MPATRARVATAKSMFGSGRDLRLASASTASATASCPDFGAARRTRSSSRTARGSPAGYAKCPKPGICSPRRSSSPTTRGTSVRAAGRGQHESPRPGTPRRAARRSPRPSPSGPPRTDPPAPTRRSARPAWRRRARGRPAAPARPTGPGAGRGWAGRRAAATTAGPRSDNPDPDTLIRIPRGDPVRGDPVRGDRAGGRRGQAVHHPGDDAPARRAHRLRVQVQPQRIGGGHGRHDDLEPLERQRPGRQRGLRAPAHLQRGGRRLPRRRRRSLRAQRPDRPVPRAGGELAGPQQLGHVLEGAAGGEAGPRRGRGSAAGRPRSG